MLQLAVLFDRPKPMMTQLVAAQGLLICNNYQPQRAVRHLG